MKQQTHVNSTRRPSDRKLIRNRICVFGYYVDDRAVAPSSLLEIERAKRCRAPPMTSKIVGNKKVQLVLREDQK